MSLAFISQIVEYLKETVMAHLYLGSFLASLIETIIPPVPSEITMPLAGYLASLTENSYFSLIIVIFFATIGACFGAFIIYYISLVFGRKIILKYGKYVWINKEKLASSENWFRKYGNKAVFFGRMAPGIRELVSIPAGIAKMNVLKFLVFTFFGTLVWTSFLVVLGFLLGTYTENLNLSGILGRIGIIILLTLLCYFIFRKIIKTYKN